MIKANWRLLGSVIGLLAVAAIIFFFATKQTEDQSDTMNIQENMQAAIEQNRAQGSRVARGVYIIDRKGFEKDVGANITKTKGVTKRMGKGSLKFVYLYDKDAQSKVSIKGGSVGFSAGSSAKYIAVKGVRVLVNLNNNSSFTDENDMVGTLAIDSKSEPDSSTDKNHYGEDNTTNARAVADANTAAKEAAGTTNINHPADKNDPTRGTSGLTKGITRNPIDDENSYLQK